MNIKNFIKEGAYTGHFDYLRNEFRVGSIVEYIDSEGFTCRTKVIVGDNYWIGIEGWDRLVGISEMENGDYKVVQDL